MSTAQPTPARRVPTAAEVRQGFIDFFVRRHGHVFVPSSPCVPHHDPTLLFTNAGMNQFKPIFLGQAAPGSEFARLKRAANSQKCIRAGGKHNDLEDVGKDLYHHTFFEMLGNWSFGDYFKEEAIAWAWELLTKVWGIDPERLYATYFEGDKSQGLEPDREAYEIWRKYLPGQRVLPGNMKDNFWEMGDTGPCGPCSEIHYDGRSDEERAREPGYNHVNRGHPDVIEIWNNVFIQFNRTESGLRPLPARHVDTGMGLERVVRVLQGRRSNYDTDLFTPIFDAIHRLTGAPAYTGALESHRDIAYRVVADHARTLTFAITDGALPSNEGRGYVLRRILRRAFRHARQHLGARGPILCDVVPTIVEHFGPFFPELRKDPARVASVVRGEEEAFARTIDRGLAHFEEALAAGAKRVAADAAFRLHDTYGFPIDLTQVMAEERGVSVDIAGFESLMAEAKARSRTGARGEASGDLELSGDEVAKLMHLRVSPTEDADKFHGRPVRAAVRAIWNGHNFDEHIDAAATHVDDRFGVVLDRTNFYAEMGGQAGDAGALRHAALSGHGGSAADFEVESTRVYGGYVLHAGRLRSGRLRVGDEVECRVDERRRAPIMANHTATHLLNLALREALGDGADQKGSLVAPDRLRFDFAAGHGLTDEQVVRAESAVRQRIAENLAVHAETVPLERARAINGLRAVFGEAYPDPVRVVSIGRPVADLLKDPGNADNRRFSVEFCGGTHVGAAGDIRAFAIIGEEAVSKGVRRITALTGVAAEAAIQAGASLLDRIKAASLRTDESFLQEVHDIAASMDSLTLPTSLRRRAAAALAELQERVKQAQKQSAAAGRDRAVEAARLIADKAPPDDAAIIAKLPEGSDRDALLAAMDAVRAKRPGSAVLLLAVGSDGKVVIVAGAPKEIVDRGLRAGEWVREASAAVGGKGGGRPDSAQGGGPDAAKAADALRAAQAYARSRLG